MNKQIEEMAADIRLNMQIQPNPKEHPSHQLARLLVEDGYRKASDVARWIFAEIEKLMQEVMNENADLIRKRNTIIFGKKDPDSFIWAYNGRIDGMHQLRAKMTDLKKKYESEGADDEGQHS